MNLASKGDYFVSQDRGGIVCLSCVTSGNVIPRQKSTNSTYLSKITLWSISTTRKSGWNSEVSVII